MASSTKRRFPPEESLRTEDKLHLRQKPIQTQQPAFDATSPIGSDGESSDTEESVYSGLDEEEEGSSNSEYDSSEEQSSDEVQESSEVLTNSKPEQESSSNETGRTVVQTEDEYQFDSSDEEDIRNTVGNVPMEWYKDYAHIGYDLTGGKILKPKMGDELDKFLDKMENPDYFKTVRDKQTGQDIVLTDQDVDTVTRLQKGHYPDGDYNPYEEWVEFFTRDTMIHPLSNRPEHKRSFVPSNWERLKVGRLVHAIKMGWIKPRERRTRVDDEDAADDHGATFHDLWVQDDATADIVKRLRPHIPAPKLPLPGHAESYNPPPEYLLSTGEEAAWREQEPEDRRQNFIPQKYSSLRLVPSYAHYVNERFERCLDLYLCPRQQKMRMNVNPEDLVPKLPKPKDLQPFPTTQAVVYKGHTNFVRCIGVDPSGQWLASGSDDESIKFWEIQTGRCRKTVSVDGPVKSLCWNPNSAYCLVAAAIGDSVLLINAGLGDKLVSSNTDHLVDEVQVQDDDTSSKKLPVDWTVFNENSSKKDGLLMKLVHAKPVSQVTWHCKGDYFAVTMPQGEKQSVIIHQMSKRRSQNPFTKAKGLVQCVLFHPVKPFFFVATQKYVRVYNLVKQELTKKMIANCKWISSLAVHPAGDNLIVGSYDCRLNWFDMDLSTKPYQTLKHQKKALRSVCFHKKYPLFASASDDGTVVVCHGMVYNDFMQNPLIVPVKILKGHDIVSGLGVLDCQFHPTQPWVFTSGADSTVRLFT